MLFMDLKRTKLTVFIAAIIATGCSANKLESATTDKEYCRNGGASSDYSCNNASQNTDPSNTVTASNPNTEAWMNSKLSDIKSWLKTIKENPDTALGTSKPSNTAMMVRNPAATTPELVRIEALSQQGDNRAAMAAINSFLAKHPDNLEAELTKGLVLSNMNQIDEAETLLRNAITRHPTSPELYNNLAVIYSNKGNYGEAIETLLLAFSTHPSYAQVNENLREVYASVASLAYNRALDLDSDKKLTPKLVVLRRTSVQSLPAKTHSTLSTATAQIAANNPVAPSVGTQQLTRKTAADSTATTTVTVEHNKTKQVNLPLPELKDSQPSVEITEMKIKPTVTQSAKQPKKSIVRVDNKPVSRVVQAPKPVTSVPAKSPLKPKSPALTSTIDAVKAVRRWSWTWTSQNVSAYLGSYVKDYSPKAGVSHSQWRAQRTQRLTKPSFIKVKLSNLSSKRVGSDRVEVTFLQKYQANTYKDQTQKRLTMKKVGNRWLISKEQSI